MGALGGSDPGLGDSSGEGRELLRERACVMGYLQRRCVLPTVLAGCLLGR